MAIRLKLKHGQKGTKKLLAIYGEDLVCVRYRYDFDTRMRIKTAEIVVERKSWTPPALQFGADEIVPGADSGCRESSPEDGASRWWDVGFESESLARSLRRDPRNRA
jgi:hypothetical protein